MKIILVFLSLIICGCAKVEDPALDLSLSSEISQIIGDSVISIDEAGGSTSGLLSRATVTAAEDPVKCNAVAFSACSTGIKTKNFNNCVTATVAGSKGSVSGSLNLTYSDNTCSMSAVNATVSQAPNVNIKNSKGTQYQVTALTTGQTIQRQTLGGVFTFNNTGIKRKIVQPSGAVALDIETRTTAAINFTGNARTNRTISSGTVETKDNLTGKVCTVSPSVAVKWSLAGCNCPSEGEWSGTCSDATTYKILYTNVCGEVVVTKGTEEKIVNIDRCQD